MSDIKGSGSDPFDYPNEDEIIFDPDFLCDLCGFSNVVLVDIEGRGAAKCTNCGAGYLSTDSDRHA